MDKRQPHERPLGTVSDPPPPPHHLQGNLFDFLRLTEWRGPRVLYFGDHLYSDLAVSGQGWSWEAGREQPCHC